MKLEDPKVGSPQPNEEQASGELSAASSASGEQGWSRRDFLLAGVTAAAAATLPVAVRGASREAMPASGSSNPPLLAVDYKQLVQRADLTYDKPVSRSEEGLPIGNGRMGSLLWTSGSALRLQINRPDVFAENCSTKSFSQRNTDYGSGCAFVDVDFSSNAPDVFSGSEFRQHLAVYDGLSTLNGRGIRIRTIASLDDDVILTEIEDQRKEPELIRVDLRMLRYAMQYLSRENCELASQHAVRMTHRNHAADSKLEIRDGRIVLVQRYHEGDYFCSSAVVISVAGRKSRASFANDSTVRLTAAKGNGTFTFYIGSAASFDRNEDVAAKALAEVEKAASKSFNEILAANRKWWQSYWERSLVHLHSEDGDAEFVEKHYTYFLYLMASTSRGVYPPRFGGMLWFTNGDMREWGSQHWWANTSCYYDAIPPTNRFDIMEPVFGMYSKMLPACSLAAEQQWNSKGMFIPETVWFDGLDRLPDDIASEMRDLYLLRQPWDQRSTRFREYSEHGQPHNSRWNWKNSGKWIEGRWVYADKGAGPFGQVTHIFSSGAKIAYLFWLRYEYTQDKNWLKERAYPMLRGAAEFYRNFPNVKKGADGSFHIHNVNNHEPVWGAQDTMEELAAMHGILPLTIRASELLGVDDDLRGSWRELAEKLTSLPSNDSAGALQPRAPGEPRLWISGLPPVLHGNLNAHSLVPALYFDLCSASTADPDMVNTTKATYDAIYSKGVGEHTPISVLNRDATVAAHLGRASDVRHMLVNQLRCLDPGHDFCDWAGGGKTGVLANRLTLREGPGAIGAERIGRMSEALHAGLLQCAPPVPGGDPILHVFPAWPKEWDAQYTLLARGGFLVSASQRKGEVEFVELLSEYGGVCTLKNPWNTQEVEISRAGKKADSLSGTTFTLGTKAGERILLRRAETQVPSTIQIPYADAKSST